MTSGQSLAPFGPEGFSPLADKQEQAAVPQSLFGRVQNALQSRLVTTISVSVVLSLGLTGVSAVNIWRIYQGLQTTVAQQFELQARSGEIVYLDEVLTMSSRMAASTGDTKWEDRYNEYVPQLDTAINAVLEQVPESEQTNPAQTDAANKQLIDYETQAFELVRSGKSQAALDLLLGPKYEEQKRIYSEGINGTLASVRETVANEIQSYRQRLAWSVSFAVVSVLLLSMTWYVVLVAVRGYIADRKQSQMKLMLSQDSLSQLNQNLAQEVEQRSQQEQQIRQESELLQADIGHILDVVLSLEEGNLTIEAEVNERATGLVSDTLNRLIESLNRIVAVVASTSQRVTQNAEGLELMAIETVNRARHQTQSVQDVRALMETVNTLTTDSRQQAIATGEAVQQAQTAVTTGQQEMRDMVDGIDTLQQGTDQIVKRTQLLNEFVDLAAQFSKEQKRVASLTRVMALNASTLAARALKEQNPDQFTSIAHEFDTIARQVDDLATETNQGLILLQQRTDQIQTVTSGLNQDVGEINQLVQTFTQEVTRSRQAFDHIQSITEQVAQLGQQVSQSSETTVQAVQNALHATQAIAKVAEETEGQAATTRSEAAAMGALAHKLLEMVEFFQVNTAVLEQEAMAAAPEAASLPAQSQAAPPTPMEHLASLPS